MSGILRLSIRGLSLFTDGAKRSRRIGTVPAWILIIFIFAAAFACGKKEADDRETKAVKETVRLYDEALIKVYTALDPKPLYGLASEKEIGRVRMIIWKFLGDKTFMEAELKEIRFDKVEMKGDSAEAETWEKWRFRHLREGTREEVRPWADAEYRLVFAMTKQDGRWLVDSAKFQGGEK